MNDGTIREHTAGPSVQKVRILVVGGGPAGSVVARLLASAGQELAVTLVDDSPLNPTITKLGESLPPITKPTLRALQILDRIEADAEVHMPYVGNVSLWGQPYDPATPLANLLGSDFIANPNGTGYHLDRARFDAMLRQLASEQGATLAEATRVVSLRRLDRQWTATLKSSERDQVDREETFDWVVDASGRTNKLSQAQGLARPLQRVAEDRLLAFAVIMSTDTSDVSELSVVEASEEGWWYTCRLHSARRIFVFHTDEDLPVAKQARKLSGWLELLDLAPVMTKLANEHACRPYDATRAVKCVAANSARATQFSSEEERWMLVGDAALSFDPLSSQGIHKALLTAVYCAQQLYDHITRKVPLEPFARELEKEWRLYSHEKARYYGLCHRPSQFWTRRKT